MLQRAINVLGVNTILFVVDVRQGYGLEQLVNDRNYRVRRVVAQQRFGFKQLMCDESVRVRAAVAEQGFWLDVLVHDKSEEVLGMALHMMERQSFS